MNKGNSVMKENEKRSHKISTASLDSIQRTISDTYSSSSNFRLLCSKRLNFEKIRFLSKIIYLMKNFEYVIKTMYVLSCIRKVKKIYK